MAMKRRDKIILTIGIFILLSPLFYFLYLTISFTHPSNYDDIDEFLSKINYKSAGSVLSQEDHYSSFSPTRTITFTTPETGEILYQRIQELPQAKCEFKVNFFVSTAQLKLLYTLLLTPQYCI